MTPLTYTLTLHVALPISTLQVSTPNASIEQPATAGSTDQEIPGPDGSGSVIVTPCAVPAPMLVSVAVNPIESPALTGFGSATFVILMSAQLTVVAADASP